jgi:excisionase family DNA binding protein
MKPSTLPDGFTVREVAEALNHHPDTIHRLRRSGELEGFRSGSPIKGHWKITAESLDAYIARRTQPSTERKAA